MKFKDKVRLQLISGKGGSGYVAFNRARKPSGGDGGKGGDIIFEGSIHVTDLSHFHENTKFKAENGTQGGRERTHGKNGEDKIIKVPLVTNVYDLEGNLLFTVDKDGEQYVALEGGKGGYGNYFFKRKGQIFREKATGGMDAQELTVKLELELESDIIFIGLPNAGKSSILAELTNAHAKIAAYEFTTLDPQLGITEGMKLMDLPGLIEHTSEGKGLGVGFEKHTRRTRMLAHFLSLEAEDPIENYKIIRREIESISDHLKNLPEVVVLTKSDLVDKDKVKKIVTKVKKLNKKTIVTSVYDYDALQELKEFFKENLPEKIEPEEENGDEKISDLE